MRLSDLHSSKAKCPIEVTEGGITISLSDEQLLKGLFLISFKEEGIAIVFNKLQLRKQQTSIIFIAFA